MNEPNIIWDAEKGIATCTIIDNQGRKFIGIAKCHPDDLDFNSELTGCTIASYRSMIKYLKSVKRDIIQPELNALKQLYYSMNKSKKFNPKSYENIMLQRQIHLKEEDLATIEEELARIEQELTSYISKKDITYKKWRELRAQRKPQDEV